MKGTSIPGIQFQNSEKRISILLQVTADGATAYCVGGGYVQILLVRGEHSPLMIAF